MNSSSSVNSTFVRPQIVIGADHRGFALKNELLAKLELQGYIVEDCGNAVFDPNDDYPDYALAVAEKVARSQVTSDGNPARAPAVLGVVICGSGVGATIAANKVDGARAAQAISPAEIEHARQADDANILALSADHMDTDQAMTWIETFLTTSYEGAERHQRRLQKIANYEKRN